MYIVILVEKKANKFCMSLVWLTGLYAAKCGRFEASIAGNVIQFHYIMNTFTSTAMHFIQQKG